MTERGSIRAVVLGILIAVIVAVVAEHPAHEFLINWQNHPRILTRGSAATVIQGSAQFRHKTKLFFTISQAESVIPGVCDNFEFSPEKMQVLGEYLKTGTMKFSPYGNQMPPFLPASFGSVDLSIDGRFLLDHIDSCKSREVSKTTGAYELRLGKTVVQVTGIRGSGNQALVDFRWHFESINEVGQALPRIRFAKEMEIADPHVTAEEKSITPFWTGSAEFTKYDDGWRIGTINFGSKPWDRWVYGPDWPDPNFNWNAFDESENH
jgi:hypothetical protein